MKLLASFLGVLFCGPIAFASITIGEKFLLPNVSYVQTGQTVVTTAVNSAGKNLLSRTEDGKTFYLNFLSIEGAFDVISSSATRLGYCSLQVPTGTTVAKWSFNNPTTSAIDRVVIPNPWPVPITSSFTISCAPATATQINWAIDYNGFEY